MIPLPSPKNRRQQYAPQPQEGGTFGLRAKSRIYILYWRAQLESPDWTIQ